jgi:hypothetical protein
MIQGKCDGMRGGEYRAADCDWAAAVAGAADCRREILSTITKLPHVNSAGSHINCCFNVSLLLPLFKKFEKFLLRQICIVKMRICFMFKD